MSAPEQIRDDARTIWQAGVDAVGGYNAVTRALKKGPAERPDQIVAVGKAAAAMTRAALDHFGALPALVVTKDGHGDGLPTEVTLIESAHPVPDERSLKAGRALRECVAGMTADSHLLLLVSGGASALAEDLTEGHTLKDLAALNRSLLASGKDITEMNVERRQISRIKGGGLLSAFAGATAQVLAISDVPGDDIAVIGSGIGALPPTPNFAATTRIVASNTHARDAALAEAERRGYQILSSGEELHNDLDTLAHQWGPRLSNMEKGAIILGGEPTVRLPDNPGQGGRNQALALALSRHITGRDDITLIVGGTDGSDGPTDAAGGLVDGSTWTDSAQHALNRADSGPYLAANNALLTTGPTGTNVMDLLIALRC